MVILCACRISILIGHKKRQQAFLTPLPGKQLAKDIVDSLINSTSLLPLTLAGLPLLSLSFDRCRAVHDWFRPTKLLPPKSRKNWESCETPRRPTSEKYHLAYQFTFHFSILIHGKDSSSVFCPVQQPHSY